MKYEIWLKFSYNPFHFRLITRITSNIYIYIYIFLLFSACTSTE